MAGLLPVLAIEGFGDLSSTRGKPEALGGCGIWVCVRPRWANASLTALEKAETPPTFGDSPTPLAPIGWCGDGVVVKSVSQLGVSTAVGRKKSRRLALVRLPDSS